MTVENLEDFTVLSQLWMTDGTEEGTQMVFQAPGKDWGYSITNLTVLGDRLLFMAPTGTDVDGFAINHELHALTIPEPAGAALAAVGGLLLLRRRRGM